MPRRANGLRPAWRGEEVKAATAINFLRKGRIGHNQVESASLICRLRLWRWLWLRSR